MLYAACFRLPIKRTVLCSSGDTRLLAITPAQSRNVASEEARRICVDFTIRGLGIIAQLPRGENAEPLRFIYVSGALGERDPSKKPWILGDYLLMRVCCLFLIPPFFPLS